MSEQLELDFDLRQGHIWNVLWERAERQVRSYINWKITITCHKCNRYHVTFMRGSNHPRHTTIYQHVRRTCPDFAADDCLGKPPL